MVELSHLAPVSTSKTPHGHGSSGKILPSTPSASRLPQKAGCPGLTEEAPESSYAMTPEDGSCLPIRPQWFPEPTLNEPTTCNHLCGRCTRSSLRRLRP